MDEQAALSKIKMKNNSCYHYLRTNDKKDYKLYIKYRNQSKIACRKSILSRESVTLPELTTASESNSKFSTEDFFSKCDQIRRKLQIWSHLPKKLLVENFIFFAVLPTKIRKN